MAEDEQHAVFVLDDIANLAAEFLERGYDCAVVVVLAFGFSDSVSDFEVDFHIPIHTSSPTSRLTSSSLVKGPIALCPSTRTYQPRLRCLFDVLPSPSFLYAYFSNRSSMETTTALHLTFMVFLGQSRVWTLVISEPQHG